MSHVWTGSWITTPTPPVGSGPMPLFRRSLQIDPSRPVRRATLRLCGLGHFELRVNGLKVGHDVLEPGWTDYRKTCLYSTRDVTALLQGGENVIGVFLGNGMYRVAGGRYRKFKGSFGPPCLIADLSIEYEDDSRRSIGTDSTWRTCAGPIRFSCIYGGEDYDARLEPHGWDRPGFDDAQWHAAIGCDGPDGELIEQSSPPSRIMQRLSARSVREIVPGVRVFDFGQNLSGWPAMKVCGEAGKSITLKTGELLDAEGRVSQRNTGAPVTFSYTCASDQAVDWHPRFSLTGFRYVEASGDLDALAALEAHFVHGAVPLVGGFECSNPHLNAIHELILCAIRSNLHSVMTDCPHREKLGWLEQAHLMAPSVLCNFEASGLFAKIARDMRDAQHDNGMVPTTAPQYTRFNPPWDVFNDSPEWGAAIVLTPWIAYLHSGDLALLRDDVEAMRGFVAYLASRSDGRGIIAYGLGDWYDIGLGDPGFGKLTTLGVTATAIYIQCLDAIARVMTLLDRADEATIYRAEASKTRHAFNSVFFDDARKRYDRGSQTAQAMALTLDLCETMHRQEVLNVLITDIRAQGNHITAGDIGFRYVLQALSDAGRDDVIFDLLMEPSAPSYRAQIAAGATTLTEAWDANPAKSLNHMMLGHAEEWFHQGLAGIRVQLGAPPDEPQVVIAPAVVGDVRWVRAHHDLPAGRVGVFWQRDGGSLTVEVTLPVGVRAAVYVPGAAAPVTLNAGTHRLVGSVPV